MATESETMWGVISPEYGVLPFTLRQTRRDAIAQMDPTMDTPWSSYRRDGFRAVKVTLTWEAR